MRIRITRRPRLPRSNNSRLFIRHSSDVRSRSRLVSPNLSSSRKILTELSHTLLIRRIWTPSTIFTLHLRLMNRSKISSLRQSNIAENLNSRLRISTIKLFTLQLMTWVVALNRNRTIRSISITKRISDNKMTLSSVKENISSTKILTKNTY